MKQSKIKRFLAGIVTGAMLLTGVPTVALAAGGTVAGEPETISIQVMDSLQRKNDFNDGWKFNLGDVSNAQNSAFDDSVWDSVDLPHDFSIFQEFSESGEAESGFLPGGTGWYRKSFILSEKYADQQFLLNFDGAYSSTYLYVNGQAVGENHFGYGSFAFDITDYLILDGSTENVIAVKVVNQLPNSRFYSGSGIYRDVTLVMTNDVHVDRQGTQITTPDIADGDGTVAAAVNVVNSGDSDASVTVTNEIYEKGGRAVVAKAAQTVSVGAGETVTVNADSKVSKPKLWSVDEPNLYTMKTVLTVDGKVVDTYESEFGFRWAEYKDTGFYLNGEATKLNGMCLHHDQGALGAAAYTDAIYRQLVIMKNMGCNAIRVTHNPADEDFIAICNELGLLVIEEAFDMWTQPRNGNTHDFSEYFDEPLGEDNGIYGGEADMTWAEFAIKEMVRRDVNAPSIIMWSIGNEVQNATTGSTNHFPQVAQELIDWVQEVDETRPCTIGSNLRETSTTSTFGQILHLLDDEGGVVGFNYLKEQNERDSLYNEYGAYLASETASATTSRGSYRGTRNNSDIDGNYHLTSYDSSSVSWGRTVHQVIWDINRTDYIYGQFVWTGFDYIGEPTPWNGKNPGKGDGNSRLYAAPNSSYMGSVDTAGFVKDSYYLYRAQWNQDAYTLHLVNAWDADNQTINNGKTPVWVYSNAPVVKLYRDGELIGTATRKVNTTAAGHVYYTYTTQSNNTSVCTTTSGSGSSSLYSVFDVVYKAGTISAKAFDENGAEIQLDENSGRTTVSTPGAPDHLNAYANKDEIAADGDSLVYITVDLEDAQGSLDTDPDPADAPLVKISLEGQGVIMGVDNGDQATTDKYQQPSVLLSDTEAQIRTFTGKALVIVKSTEEAGSITVNVSADGLKGDSITVETTEVDNGDETNGLVGCTMVRDYSVRVGTAPQFQTGATGVMADGSTVKGTIQWNAVDADSYNTVGDYSIDGVVTFANGQTRKVSCRLHVIENVIAMRNIAAATTPGLTPALPDTVTGILPDGTLGGQFTVAWEKMNESDFATVGDVITVNGTVTVLGEELPVTASVRVAEAENQEPQNEAPGADFLTQDVPAANQSDNLYSLWDGETDPYATAATSDTTKRWTNWGNRTTSDTVTLEFEWNTVRVIGSVKLYYYIRNNTVLPSEVKFQYSANGTDYTDIPYTEDTQIVNLATGQMRTYNFDEPVQPIKLRIILTQPGGTGGNCIGMTEIEIMSYAAGYTSQTSADLAAITGVTVEDFDPEVLSYEALGGSPADVAAEGAENVGITVLPSYKNVVRILTVSEDGKSGKTYEVIFANPFTDVEEDDYCYAPVLWAVKESITTGATATTFEPNKPCTRGQVVTFLWRAAGEPEPANTENPFTDVETDDYCYTAILWAVEEEITNGTSAATFEPDKACTRGEVATFLYRFDGENPAEAENPFEDVSAGRFYYDAVLWAVENEITTGTEPGKFEPNAECTRGQVVTFLYRYMG